MGLVLILTNSCEKEDDEETPSTTITDKDGNVYTSVIIGTQEWMVENLKTTKYNDGTDIPLVTDDYEWEVLTTPGYCWYDNDITNKTPYGALYNWYAVNTGKLCPTGWHVHTDAEWTTLTTYLGGENVAGGKLKEAGTTHWASPNTGAVDEYDFTALPGGGRDVDGTFLYFGYEGYWWSATGYSATDAYCWAMYYDYSRIFRNYVSKKVGFSVRCVKN